MGKGDKKSEKKKAPKVVSATPAAKSTKPVPASSKEILARAQVQVPANEKGKKAAKPVKKPAPKESSDSSDSDSESEEIKPKAVTNGKANKESSDESSDTSSSEDEKPKALQVKAPAKTATSSSDSSSDTDDGAPTKIQRPVATKPTATPGKSKVAPPAKAVSSSSESESASEDASDDSGNDEGKEGKVVSKVVNGAVKAISEKKKDDSSESSDDSDSDSEELQTSPKTLNKAATESDSSDSSSSSSDSDSDGKPKVTTVKKTELAGSEDSGSSSESTDDDVDMADDTKAATKPTTNGKRKITEDEKPQAKRTKLEPAAQETKSIFVGRLSWSVDSDRLAQEFAHCGEVVSATVQTDRNTGKSRGFGYVHFSTAEAVEKALEMSGQEIDGRAVNVDRSIPPDPNQTRENRSKAFSDRVSPPSSTLFVANLPFTISEDTLWSYFEGYSVKTIRLPTDRETGQPKGFGYVELEGVEDAKKAFEALSGTEIEGRRIRLDYSQPRDSSGGDRGGRGGFGDRGGRGGFGDRGGRGGFGGRGGGGRGGGRGWGDRGGRGGRGGYGRGAPRGTPRHGGIAAFEGKKVTF